MFWGAELMATALLGPLPVLVVVLVAARLIARI